MKNALLIDHSRFHFFGWRAILTALGLVLSLVSSTPVVSAQEAFWSTCQGGNGHRYEAVLAPGISWQAASLAATQAGGHLATLATSSENAFVFSLLSGPFWSVVGQDTRGPWLGGFQAPSASEPDGGWQWVTSEPFSFAAWANGEPNNAGDEGHLHYLGKGQGVCAPTWNDLNQGAFATGYVIEYETCAVEQCTCSSASSPKIFLRGCAQLDVPFVIHGHDLPPGSACALVYSVNAVEPFGLLRNGCAWFVGRAGQLAGSTVANGEGQVQLSLTLPSSPSLIGATITMQGVVSAGGAPVTNALRFSL